MVKVQLWDYDELVSRYGNGTASFMLGVLRERLAQGIVETHEKIARDAIFDWCDNKFLADGNKWTASTYDFSTIENTSAYQMQLSFIEDVKLRLIERSRKWTQRWGTWAAPIPMYPGDTMIMTTPNVMYDLWTSEEGEFMQDLRQLQDERIINGGEARYRGATFVDNPWLVLRNAGELSKQVGVTSPIRFGDGAPDPDSEDAVHNVFYVGQSGSDQTHYVQCSSFSSSDFTVGQIVTIHTQTTTDWGITDGCDFLDGESYEAEIVEVDATNNRLKFSEPIVYEYINSFTGTPNGGSEAVLYAYITKARDIHPILIVGARGMHTFASRRKIQIYNPIDTADLPGVIRVTWDEHGAMNRWNPFVYEIIFCAASDTVSGTAKPDLR